ncbi:hypothetical protein DEJ28_14505 [Curtobacterium sp. MCPF17_002]|uniref:hypothetical protein n=1 Tax=Curtobacterium sp. MCPF17_002 TaxID=2175645 RepID=UPI0011B7E5F3|nr:hypothetical protein [Curtobacterium sp. MCPF17_002]WIB76851.1 hypothetical protein DEJ28_14505 [Curtobacterium sp. MCPF17_002]
MAGPRARPGLVVAAVFLVGGVVVSAAAVLAVLGGRGNDVAWVSLVLGLLLIGWALAFQRLADTDTDGDPLRPTRLLSTGLAMAAAYVVVRLVGRPVDSAVFGALVLAAWTVVHRLLDRRVRRRRAEGAGDAAGPAAD